MIISFVKVVAILVLTMTLSLSMLVSAVSSFSMNAKSNLDDLLSFLPYKERGVLEGKQNNIVVDIKSIENKTSSSLSSINQVQGTVIVTTKVINAGGGTKKPSDFTIIIHGNDPSPSSFSGNSSGTHVKLHMGMYSVTERGLSGYNSTSSDDCSGGMMSIETKNCTITNIYSKAGVR